MSSGGYNHGPGRNDHHEGHANDQASQAQRGAHRRPSMAIQDMLNPVGGEKASRPSTNGPLEDGASGRNPGPTSFSYVNNDSETTSSSPPPPSNQGSPSLRASGNRERRQFRPTYLDEEVFFIWYYRIDLGYEWQEISHAYNAQFPHRKRDGFGGMQCKYYRYCEGSGIPKVRDRDRAAPQVLEYGMRARTGLTYPWMKD